MYVYVCIYIYIYVYIYIQISYPTTSSTFIPSPFVQAKMPTVSSACLGVPAPVADAPSPTGGSGAAVPDVSPSRGGIVFSQKKTVEVISGNFLGISERVISPNVW